MEILDYTLAKAGRTEEARKILAELTEEAKTQYVSWLGIAYLYAGLGERIIPSPLSNWLISKEILDWTSSAPASAGIPFGRPMRAARLLKKLGLPPLS